MSRPRTQGRKNWPPNLNLRVSKARARYYSWCDPRTGREKSLKAKNNLKLATERAIQLNAIVAAEMDRMMIEVLSQNVKGVRFDIFSEAYYDSCVNRGHKENTLRSLKSRIKRLNASLGNLVLNSITAKHISEVIDAVYAEGKHRSAEVLRSTAIEIFKEAKAKGVFPDTRDNPAQITRMPGRVKVKRSRLQLNELNIFLDHSNKFDPWLRNSLLLALVTGQAREDLSLARFKRDNDWYQMRDDFMKEKSREMPYSFIEDGYYHATRQKTGALIKIPLSLKLEAIGLSIGDVVEICQDNVNSKYILHHTMRRTKSELGDPIHKDTLSRRFAALRNSTLLKWDSPKPPTFHEIRSLAERCYREQGVNTQNLLGHKNMSTTEKYHDLRGSDWIEVK
ncbi:hypothetical protein MNBD_GAMMA12-1781 [hydrothermal vent metagenome]|uniref:Core-binding (CB) domain-containing protein n=1 Tax=hydrothermal vent metagenome TaxID=652676 RepID=A0A3B0XWD1_9ZZZZ